MIVNDLFPSVDAETKTTLFMQLAFHLEVCIHAYCEATSGKWELVPSRN